MVNRSVPAKFSKYQCHRTSRKDEIIPTIPSPRYKAAYAVFSQEAKPQLGTTPATPFSDHATPPLTDRSSSATSSSSTDMDIESDGDDSVDESDYYNSYVRTRIPAYKIPSIYGEMQQDPEPVADDLFIEQELSSNSNNPEADHATASNNVATEFTAPGIDAVAWTSEVRNSDQHSSELPSDNELFEEHSNRTLADPKAEEELVSNASEGEGEDPDLSLTDLNAEQELTSDASDDEVIEVPSAVLTLTHLNASEFISRKAAAHEAVKAWIRAGTRDGIDYKVVKLFLKKRGFMCLYCDEIVKGDFNRHCQKHNPEPFMQQCPHCSYRALQNCNVQSHIGRAHQIPCGFDDCDALFTDPSVRTRHRQAVHEENPRRRYFPTQIAAHVKTKKSNYNRNPRTSRD
ncbi:hypothetical protein HGRIS_003777 [Hohenbuehelia grisea]|uniref:C2H2-type domain-containing protein n=1 Tax=Hohenbuehelia grisea TaxID=104357 RepID=A0ABR3JHK7_9AGAR